MLRLKVLEVLNRDEYVCRDKDYSCEDGFIYLFSLDDKKYALCGTHLRELLEDKVVDILFSARMEQRNKDDAKARGGKNK